MTMDKLPRVEAGKRAMVLGKTGSGKTVGGAWLLSRSPGRWVVLNSKYDSLLTKLGPSVDWKTDQILKGLKNNRVIIAHPETYESDDLDDVLFDLCETRQPVSVFVDELLYLHKGNGRAGPGLLGLLTRGRSRGQSFIGCTQRPAFVSNFCYSESEYFAAYNLQMPKDWQKVIEFTGHPEIKRARDKHHWAWVDVSEGTLREYGPVPASDIERRFDNRRK